LISTNNKSESLCTQHKEAIMMLHADHVSQNEVDTLHIMLFNQYQVHATFYTRLSEPPYGAN